MFRVSRKPFFIVVLQSLIKAILTIVFLVSNSNAEDTSQSISSYSLGTYAAITGDPAKWKNYTSFDSDGRLLVDYTTLYGTALGKQFNPLTASQLALANYNYFLKTGQASYLDSFIQLAEMLAQNFVRIDDSRITYLYEFDYTRYKIKKPWSSGLANSTVLSVLLRLYLLNESEKLHRVMQDLKNTLMSKVSIKGNSVDLLGDGVWIEEYPSDPPSLVLNGFLFSVVSLNEYIKIFPNDADLQGFLDSCFLSLKKNFHFYDTGDWLLYDRIEKSRVNTHYMKFQSILLQQLFLDTNDNFF